jgi:hypothetical protein
MNEHITGVPPVKAASAIVRVGHGRGFVIKRRFEVEGFKGWRRKRLVVTAAHCLPRLPVIHGEPGWADWDETYKDLLAPLGAEPTIWAECLFVDPIADIAVLGQPNNQALSDQADAYDALVEVATPLRIAAPGTEGWLLSLDGVWFRSTLQTFGGPFWLTDMGGKFVGGMSGSPIVSTSGAAVGVACLGGEIGGRQAEIIGPQPSLTGNLPGWLLLGARR